MTEHEINILEDMLPEVKKLETMLDDEKHRILEKLSNNYDSLYHKELIIDAIKYIYLMRGLLEEHVATSIINEVRGDK